MVKNLANGNGDWRRGLSVKIKKYGKRSKMRTAIREEPTKLPLIREEMPKP